METFGDRVKRIIENNHISQKAVADRLGISQAFMSDVIKGRGMFSIENLTSFAREFDVDLNWLIFGKVREVPSSETAMIFRDVRGQIVPSEQVPEFALVPIHSQKVSAGAGQEALDDEIIGWLPVPVRMFRGEPYQNARACVVRGDSMTGIMMMDGDYVIFNVGVVQGNGVYVLRVGDELLVKRIDFDHFKRRLIITSENSRYPERVELVEDDMDNVMIVGKVFGWTHVHPY
jgi:phage repressor protein C with HTH and peptisase S24 domain